MHSNIPDTDSQHMHKCRETNSDFLSMMEKEKTTLTHIAPTKNAICAMNFMSLVHGNDAIK